MQLKVTIERLLAIEEQERDKGTKDVTTCPPMEDLIVIYATLSHISSNQHG